MKQFFTLFLAASLVCQTLYSDELFEVKDGGQPEHLVPVNADDDLPSYRKRIAEHLLVTPADLGLMITWAPRGESVVAVYEKISEEALKRNDGLAVLVPDEEKKFFITVTVATESLWYSMPKKQAEKKEVKIERHDFEISRDLAVAIQRAWAQMLVRSRYPEKSNLVCDGIAYEFGVFVRGLGFIRGEATNPDSGLPDRMVGLGSRLRAIAMAGKPLAPEEEKKQIAALKDFEELVIKR